MKIVVSCAGTSDLMVAEEAAVTLGAVEWTVDSPTLNFDKIFVWPLELAGYSIERLYDVGIAGIYRLFRNIDLVQEADAIICVAGMDGALPGVIVSFPMTSSDVHS